MDIKIEEDSGVPFYRQIKEQVIQQIRLGQLVAGIQLPSVRELSGRLFVSLITIRRAYADLEEEGWIKRRRGYGTYVSEKAQITTQEQLQQEGRAILKKAFCAVEELGFEKAQILQEVESFYSSRGEE